MVRKKGPASKSAPQTGGERAALPEPLPRPPAQPEQMEAARLSFPVVGIGASAGGLAAFEGFFSAIPDQPTGMAFVLVQHLAPDYKSILAELVGRFTCMQVLEVTDGLTVQPDCVYVIPPNRDLALLNGTLHLFEPAMPRGLRMPIDFFFRSLAQDLAEQAICVVLSGTGSDGSLGLRAVKGEGGMAMVQAPDLVQYDGMPRSALATGLVDYVLPAEAMFGQIEAYVSHAFRKRPERVVPPEPSSSGDTLKKIFVILRAQTSHDFSSYKENTIRRRMERRMALHQLEAGEDYLRLLRGNPEEVEALFRDFLIGVTSFFRDPAAFKVLKEEVLPRLFADRAPGEPLRAWVCGCSTGEEAYTLAMLIQEHMDELRACFKVQIFGTDIDRAAIETARAGIYPASIAADVPAAYLRRYFSHDPDGGTFRIRKNIRDLLIFSEQDVIKDPPFSKLDLLSCRNLLIYLNLELQKKILPLFAYALNIHGYLLLGTAETLGDYASLFTPVNRKLKVFMRREEPTGAALLPLTELLTGPGLVGSPVRRGAALANNGKLELKTFTEQALLGYYVQAAFLVNSSGDILHIVGRSGKFLEPPPGEPVMNLLAMAREGLQLELTAAFHRVVAHKQPVLLRGLTVQGEGASLMVNVGVRLAEARGNNPAELYLVVLEEVPPVTPGLDALGPVDRRIDALEQQLRSKEENLRTALEEMGTSNEELKSTNEEIQSVNEELQSTNEELETSKEELQAVNEELATVNGELQNKVQDLSRANNDMNNLLSSTGVGVLVLDPQLCVSRFTPAIANVINLIPADIGRSVAHFASNLDPYHDFFRDIQAVLETLIPREVEVMVKGGAWYLMRIRPYRTADNVIEGLVITCVEITERKRTEGELQEQELQRQAVLASGLGLGWQDCGSGPLYLAPELRRMLGLPAEGASTLEQLFSGIHPEDLARVRSQQAALLAAGGPSQIRCECRFQRTDGGFHPVLLLATLAFQDGPRGRVPQGLTLVALELGGPGV